MLHLKVFLILNILFLKLVNADDFDNDRYSRVSSIVIIYFIVLIFVICCAISCCNQEEESIYQNVPYNPQQPNQIGPNQPGFVNHAYVPNIILSNNQMSSNQPIYNQSLLSNQQTLNQLPPPYHPNINRQPYNQAYHQPQFNTNQRY